MANLSKDKSGNRTIQFVAGGRKRRSIRLGKMPQKDASNIKSKVEALNAAAISQTIRVLNLLIAVGGSIRGRPLVAFCDALCGDVGVLRGVMAMRRTALKR